MFRTRHIDLNFNLMQILPGFCQRPPKLGTSICIQARAIYSDLVILHDPATLGCLHERNAPASAAALLAAAHEAPQDCPDASSAVLETAKALCFGIVLNLE